MTRYRLHYFAESGNSYKLALMLALCGQRFEPVWTDFGSGITWTEEWRRAVNPMGEIPVLEEDGRKLTQTAPILQHLAERFGCFGGTTQEERISSRVFEGMGASDLNHLFHRIALSPVRAAGTWQAIGALWRWPEPVCSSADAEQAYCIIISSANVPENGSVPGTTGWK